MKSIRFLGAIAKDFGVWPFVLVAVVAFVAYVAVILGALTVRA